MQITAARCGKILSHPVLYRSLASYRKNVKLVSLNIFSVYYSSFCSRTTGLRGRGMPRARRDKLQMTSASTRLGNNLSAYKEPAPAVAACKVWLNCVFRWWPRTKELTALIDAELKERISLEERLKATPKRPLNGCYQEAPHPYPVLPIRLD